MCEPPLALVGLRRPPPLRRLCASLRQPPVGFLFHRYPRLLLVLLLLHIQTLAWLCRLQLALLVGPLHMFRLSGSRLLLPGLLMVLSPRTAIAIAAPPPLLLIPLPLSLRTLFTTFALRCGRCPIPLLRHGVVLSRDLTPRGLRSPLGLATVFTLRLLRWSLRSRIVRLRSTAAPSLCRQSYHARSAVMRLRISRFLRPCSR